MANTTIKGITIEFNGDTSKLGAAIKGLHKDTKKLDDELKWINKDLKLDPKNVDLLRQKTTVLKDAIQKTKNNIEELKKAEQDMKDAGVDRNSEQFRRLQRTIIEDEAALKKLNSELYKTGNARLTSLSQSLDEIGKKATSAGKKLTTSVTAPIAAMYTLAANLGSDYEENLNKIDVAFGNSADAVKAWAETAREQFGLSKVQASAAVSAFGALGKGIGLTEEEAAGMSTTLAGLSADLGSYFNVSTEDSAKALEGIFTGEAEALKKFGVVMNETNLKAFAEEQGLVYNELDQTEKTMLRYQFVLAKTTDAQGDFARTSDGTANSTKVFKAALQDLGTAIGSQLLPIITPLIQKVSDFISKIADLPAPIQKVITVAGLLLAAVGPVLLTLGGLVSGISTAVGGLSKALTFLAANPIVAIIGVIALIISALITLYQTNENFRNFVINTWTSIKNFFAGIPDFFRGLWESIKSIFNAVAEFFEGLWQRVKSAFVAFATAIGDAISGAVKNAINGVISYIENTINKAIRLINGAIGLINKLPGVSIGTIGELNLPRLAKGGVLYGAQTVIAGEAGAEAIIPLDRLFGQMDRMADRITGAGGDAVTINVYAAAGTDLNELARQIEQRIIESQKRRRLAWQ